MRSASCRVHRASSCLYRKTILGQVESVIPAPWACSHVLEPAVLRRSRSRRPRRSCPTRRRSSASACARPSWRAARRCPTRRRTSRACRPPRASPPLGVPAPRGGRARCFQTPTPDCRRARYVFSTSPGLRAQRRHRPSARGAPAGPFCKRTEGPAGGTPSAPGALGRASRRLQDHWTCAWTVF